MISKIKAYPPQRASANVLHMLMLLVLLGKPTLALAEEGDQSRRERALDLFEQAETLYDEGRLDEAVELLLEARTLHPEPVLLYNLARAYEGLGQLEEAHDAYSSFLEENPDASDRGAIERRVETIREQIAERERLATELEQRDALEANAVDEVNDINAMDERSSTVEPPRIVWPWVLMSVGLTTAAVGGVFGVLALTERQESDAAAVHLNAVEAFERAETFAIVFDVVVVIGAVIAAAGLSWALVARRRARSTGEGDLAFWRGQ